MPDDLPLVPTILFLFVVAFGRAGLTYALARWLRNAAAHRSAFLDRPSITRAEQTVRRFGAPAVTLSFLTIGVQTAVNAAAGALRMPLVVYVPALAAGAAVWAVLYATVGLAAAAALLGRLSPVLLVLALAAVVLVAVATSYGRRRRSASRS